MIMQMFKGWLNKLFGWWPWKSPTTVDRVQASHNAGWSSAPEASWHASINETASATPQTGNTSIAIEQDIENAHPDAPSSTHTVAEDTSTQSPSPMLDDNKVFGQPTILSRQPPASTSRQPVQDSTGEEKHLQFLRYLVQRGLVNEGFKQGQEPEQYRKG